MCTPGVQSPGQSVEVNRSMSLEDQQLSYTALERLISTLNQARRGDFAVRMESSGEGMEREVADCVNELLSMQQAVMKDLERLADAVVQGELHTRMAVQGAELGFERQVRAGNQIVATYARHASELRRVVRAIRGGDFARTMAVGPESSHRGGDLLRVAEELNGMVNHVDRVLSEVTRVVAEVGLDGSFNSQSHLSDVSGSWGLLVGSLNAMSGSLSEQVQDLSETARALAKGQLSARATVTSRGDLQTLKLGLNDAAEAMSGLCSEVRRASMEIAGEGKFSVEMHQGNPQGELQTTEEAANRAFGEFGRVFRWLTRSAQALADGRSDIGTLEARGEFLRPVQAFERLRESEASTQVTLENLVIGRFPEISPGASERDMTLFKLSLRLKREWFLAARGGIVAASLERRREAFADASLAWIAQTVNAVVGRMYYRVSPGQFSVVADLGLDGDQGQGSMVRTGEGLVGKVIKTRETTVLNDLGNHGVCIRTGLFELRPSSLLAFPVRHEEEVIAVIELAFSDGDASTALELMQFLEVDFAAAIQKAFGARVADDGETGAETQALQEELTISGVRMERLTKELNSRDKLLKELQREVGSLRGELAGNLQTGDQESSHVSSSGVPAPSEPG